MRVRFPPRAHRKKHQTLQFRFRHCRVFCCSPSLFCLFNITKEPLLNATASKFHKPECPIAPFFLPTKHFIAIPLTLQITDLGDFFYQPQQAPFFMKPHTLRLFLFHLYRALRVTRFHTLLPALSNAKKLHQCQFGLLATQELCSHKISHQNFPLPKHRSQNQHS